MRRSILKSVAAVAAVTVLAAACGGDDKSVLEERVDSVESVLTERVDQLQSDTDTRFADLQDIAERASKSADSAERSAAIATRHKDYVVEGREETDKAAAAARTAAETAVDHDHPHSHDPIVSEHSHNINFDDLVAEMLRDRITTVSDEAVIVVTEPAETVIEPAPAVTAPTVPAPPSTTTTLPAPEPEPPADEDATSPPDPPVEVEPAPEPEPPAEEEVSAPVEPAMTVADVRAIRSELSLISDHDWTQDNQELLDRSLDALTLGELTGFEIDLACVLEMNWWLCQSSINPNPEADLSVVERCETELPGMPEFVTTQTVYVNGEAINYEDCEDRFTRWSHIGSPFRRCFDEFELLRTWMWMNDLAEQIVKLRLTGCGIY